MHQQWVGVAGGLPFESPQLWVPRPCVFCKGGNHKFRARGFYAARFGRVALDKSEGVIKHIGADQVTGVTFGSSDGDSYQYDPSTLRMTQYQLKQGAAPNTHTGALTWNANGTLQKLQITDQINSANSQTCTYGYDDLTRLTSAICGSGWSQTFSFDPFGNLKKTGSAHFLPTYTGETGAGSPVNQYYQIPGGGSGTSNYYDANGNLKNDITHTYTWDADANMAGVDGSTVTMTYDALDRMVEQTRGSGHTQIVYGPTGAKLALMNGQTLINAFVPLPGGGQAVYNSSGLAYYRHADHLGSSRLATTPSRTKLYDVAYGPYGEDYNGSGTQDLSFTGQNQDTVAGGWSANLYDFMFREYRTAHGRWASPDPAGLGAVDPTNPQSWNRYAYVSNNPLLLVDPLGLDDCYQDSSGTWHCPGESVTVNGGAPPPIDFGMGWGYYYEMLNSGYLSYSTTSQSGGGGGGGGNGNNQAAKTPTPVVQKPPSQPDTHTHKYSDFLQCTLANKGEAFFGDDDKTGTTVLINIAPLAPANYLKGGPLPYLIVQAAYDWNIALTANKECTEMVYGK